MHSHSSECGVSGHQHLIANIQSPGIVPVIVVLHCVILHCVIDKHKQKIHKEF